MSLDAIAYPEAPAFRTDDPVGRPLEVPIDAAGDRPYFTVNDLDDIASYYRENGYVVIRDLIPRDLCDAARFWFEHEVKPYRGFIYRQTTSNPERHVLSDQGFMLNPILNVQSLDQRFFHHFRKTGLAILAHTNVQAATQAILGEQGKLVQSMYFQGNPATWAHQDTYYLDAEEIGRMAGGWFAVETIAPGAGRFFVYPKSHLIDMAKNGGDFDVAFHHGRYKELAVDVIRRHRLECRAPALRQGDVLFWSSKTMHGSLATTQPHRSRSSFTGHYIPDASRFLQFQTRLRRLDLMNVDGMNVHRPKDLNKASRRAILWVETTFPRSFQTAKKLAIKAVTR